MIIQVKTPVLIPIDGVAKYAVVEKVDERRRRYTVASEFFLSQPKPRDVVTAGDERVVVASVAWDAYKRSAVISGETTNG